MGNDSPIVVRYQQGDEMFVHSAAIYDAVYSNKDYVAEAKRIHELIAAYKWSPGRTLLEAACGTGKHAELLQADYDITLLDLDPTLLEIAAKRIPNAKMVVANMVDFDLNQQFDAITCLFSSIGYVGSVERLNQTLATFARHLVPGGVLIVEGWLYPEQFITTPAIRAIFVNEPELKIARMHNTHVEGRMSYLDFHYLVGTPEGISTFEESHALMLFTHEEYLVAFEQAGLKVEYDPQGLMGRGLYIGTKAGA